MYVVHDTAPRVSDMRLGELKHMMSCIFKYFFLICFEMCNEEYYAFICYFYDKKIQSKVLISRGKKEISVIRVFSTE